MKKKIYEILKETFPKRKIPKTFNGLKIGYYQEWDSLAHLNFMLSIERKFKIKFSLKEFSSLSDIKSIHKSVKNKKNV
jgi:acyl carrier protein|tara:strand:+ start:552 stop:785 length:234 start_codon:yes stop_codon:yes gene_type:complete